VPSDPNPPLPGRRPHPAWVVAGAGFLGLLLEMALIRWVSSEVRVFSYLKNLVLVACFLGFGAGCFLARRAVDLARSVLLLLVLVLAVRLPWPVLQDYGPRQVSVILAGLPGFMVFHQTDELTRPGTMPRLLMALAWTAAMFFVIAWIMVPFGQLTARGMARMGAPLSAYSVNVAASLAGILAFTGLSVAAMPPIGWFVPVALGCWLLGRNSRERGVLVGLSLALVLALLPADPPGQPEIWSPYQKLQLRPNGMIEVNSIGYQQMLPMARLPPGGAVRFTLPYVARPRPARVLIVGAGSGNDASTALLAGAQSVVAVEIDAVIWRLGRALHPDAPYRDPRVRVVIDDARHFLRTSRETFDTIVFSHLDSHTVLSSYSNVRLDDYIHTAEAFAEARAHLAPGGLLYVAYFSEQRFVGDRLQKNLEIAFGQPPLALEAVIDVAGRTAWPVFLLAGSPEVLAAARQAQPMWEQVGLRERGPSQGVVPSSDAWPFLPLVSPRIPLLVGLVSLLILALCAAFALLARPGGERFDRRLFWMGAAFMLVEVHNVSRLALVFGTTWQVNALVVAAILLVILASNAVCARLRRDGKRPGGWATIGLFVCLLLAWAVPLEPMLRALGPLGGTGATLLMTSPLFFAGVVFADAFAESTAPGFALGWNVLGAVVGGMAENVSYVAGIPALVPLAAVFYALALLGHARRRAPAETLAETLA
jgi:SAM-dependent methyltransferase